jgi:8-oxo-dGTP pyrophosphatase MutT (NUDIX family)
MRTAEEVLIVVTRPGPEFLVLLRSPEKHGYWNPVAGGIEDGEAPEVAALRELDEETRLTSPISFEAIPLQLGYRRPVESGGFRVTLHSFWVEAPPGWEPTLNDEHVEYRWCSAADALELLDYPEPREATRFVAGLLGVDA